MDYAEDAQPNESVRGRPKRLLPFVKNTSRSRGQGKGQGSNTTQKGGRGQATNRGPSHGTSFASGISRAGLSHNSAAMSGTGYHHLPPKPHPERMSKSGNPGATSSATLIATSSNTVSDSAMAQPRHRKFRPKMQDCARAGNSSVLNNDIVKQSLNSRPDSNTDTLLDADPPAKRRRLEEASATTPDSALVSTSTAVINAVKTEEPTTSSLDSSLGQATSGTKFITYDKYPKCRFDCGRPPDEVRNNRRSIKGSEVSALRKQGLVVDAVFIRDDGIAIDWSLPAERQPKQPTPSAATLIPQPGSRSNTPQAASVLTPSSQNSRLNKPLPPPHLNPTASASRSPHTERPAAPITAEVAYREIAIPPRCLPLRGETRSLEIWVVEQMHLLEAELGPVLVLQPELIGIGEYLTGQPVATGVKPCARLRYKQPTRIIPLSEQVQRDTIQTAGEDSTSSLRSTDQPTQPSDPITSLAGPMDASPPIAYLPRSPSPALYDDNALLIKAEKDELALDPPSPCSTPRPMLSEAAHPLPNLDTAHRTQTHPSENSSDRRIDSSNEIPPCPEPSSTAVTTDLEEIQRLRQDLETSRLEAERKHRDLEQRILELSRKHLDVGALKHETPSTIALEANTDSQARVADESKSRVLVLRRGKHDKTRRLLAPSQSLALHVSWLGVMQLVDHNTRQIVATGFEESAPDSISVEDACLLSESSVALALAGDSSQLGIATLGEKSFKYLSLSSQPHEPKGICVVVPINSSEVVTLGHDHCYFHWRFDRDTCVTNPLSISKLHQCTALAYAPLTTSIVTAGSDSGKRSKLGVYNLLDPQHIATTVDLSNHVHNIHIDPENPSLLVLELARLDDQFQVHDMRLPIYQSVQKFGYQTVVYEKGAFRTRGSSRGHCFSRGDIGIVRAWDRRNVSTYQTISVIPHQKVVDVILDGRSLICATESHQIVSYPTF